MRLVLDTNIYVSGLLLPESVPGKVLRLVSEGFAELLYSQPLMDELHRVLRDKFKYTPSDAQRAVRAVQIQGRLVRPVHLVEEITSDPSDNRVLECALDGGADVIVTGDKKHLLPLRKYRGIRILSPADFLKEFLP